MRSIKIKRKINSTLLRIKELAKYKGKEVELSITINEKIAASKIIRIDKVAGIFSAYADSNFQKNENQAWILAVKEKYEDYRR